MQVFISSTKDVISIAKKLTKSLESRGFEVFLPERHLQHGAESPHILSELRNSDAFLVLIGPKFDRSALLEREWITILEETSGLTKKLVPLRVPPAKLPNFLKRWEELRVPPAQDEERWTKFVDTIADALSPEKQVRLKPLPKADLKARERRMNEIAAFAENLRAQGL